MQELIVDLTISADEYLKQYRHPTAVVSTRSVDGRRVQFPANILQRYVTHSGIRGRFKICFGDDRRFRSIDRLA